MPESKCHDDEVQNVKSNKQECTGSSGSVSKPWKAGRRERLIIYALALVSLMVALDASVVVTALPYIAASFSMTSTQSFWVGTSYVLANTVFQLIIASLSNIFGRLPVYLSSVVLFGIGSVIAATANGVTSLLAGRSVQGIGGGGITAMTLVIITDIIPLRARPKYIAINSAAWAIGTILGPVLGGLLSERSTWRWIFWLMLPFCGLGIITMPLVLRLQANSTSIREQLRSIDWIGSIFFCISLTAFLVAISWGGSLYAWDNPATLIPLLLGALAIAFTVLYELRFVSNPLIRSSLFQSVSAVASYTGAVIQGGLLFAALYCIPLYFAAAKGESAVQVGINLLPTVVAFVPASMVAGILSTRTGHFRWAIWTGWATVATGIGLHVIWDAETPVVVWAVVQIIFGFGHGLVLTGLNTATQASASAEDAAQAASMYTFSRQLGTALGIPIATATFQNFMRGRLVAEGLDVKIAEDAVGFVGSLQQMSNDSEVKSATVRCYVAGIQGTFKVLIGFAGLALILSLFIRHMSLDQLEAQERTTASAMQVLESATLSAEDPKARA